MSITTKWGLLLFFMCQNLSSFTQTLDKYNHIGSEMYYHISYSAIPSKTERMSLESKGVRFVQYEGDYRYLIAAPVNLNLGINSQIKILPYSSKENKLGFDLNQIEAPSITRNGTNKILLAVSFIDIDHQFKLNLIRAHGGTIRKFLTDNICLIELPFSQIMEFSKYVGVAKIDNWDEHMDLLGASTGLIDHANVLANPYFGEDLSGNDIVIGMGDGGKLGDHIDFKQNWMSKSTEKSNTNHQNHIAGTIAGQGNLNPFFAGYAKNANLIIEKTNSIIEHAQDYVIANQMSITNNAYGITTVDYSNDYNTFSSLVDQQILDNNALLHVFAAGNSGATNIDAFPKGFHTIAKYTATAKNALTVGAIDNQFQIAPFSSKGPVFDGRIKPEIMANGVKMFSTGKHNQYYAESGTSMASASVSGVMSLLYQEYLDAQGTLPSSGLMKAIVCNTADDYGNYGPDYAYGFGVLNALRSLKVLKNEQYYTQSINQSQNQEHIIDIPDKLEIAKIMLYWKDAPSISPSGRRLINDLDFKIIDPNGKEIFPLVLDPNGNLTALAKEGQDHLNNIEQIYIKKPMTGKYKIVVTGTEIPNETWKYWVTYDFIKPNVTVTYPFGGESILSNHKINITWDADITNQQPFSIQYSMDNGTSWNTIAENVDAKKRSIIWTTPKTVSTNTRIKVVKKNQLSFGISEPFSMLYRPENLEFIGNCDDITLEWTSSNPENKYQIYWYIDGEMMPYGEQISATNIKLDIDFEKNKTYWFSVSAITPDGKESKRANAIYYKNDCDIALETGKVDKIQNELTTVAYPNPVTSNLVYEITSNQTKYVTIKIMDINGKIIFKSREKLAQGKNEYRFSIFKNLPAGFYFISVKDGTGMITDKVYHH